MTRNNSIPNQHILPSARSLLHFLILQAQQLLLVKDAAGRRFHTVLVVIDRVKLNEQVGGAVERFLRRNGVDEVFRAESIQHLSALLDGTHTKTPQRVIVTTIHKMGLLAKEPVLLARLLHRQRSRNDVRTVSEDSDLTFAEDADAYQRVAIITDEAHRSHSASTRAAIEEVLNTGTAVRPTVRGRGVLSRCEVCFSLLLLHLVHRLHCDAGSFDAPALRLQSQRRLADPL